MRFPVDFEAKRISSVDLEIKAVTEDADYYWVDGIASSARPDLVGDIVEPKGLKAKLPIPLLWQHDTDEPVGEVVSYRADDTYVYFRGRIPKIKEESDLRTQIEKRVQQLRYGLVKGTSIGFKAVRDMWESLSSGGIRFRESTWLELSFATIAMNPDAKLTNIKSTDVAAPGRSVVRLNEAKTAGATAKPTAAPKENEMQTVQEKIAKWEAKHASLLEQRSAIIKTAEDDGDRTLSKDELEKRAQYTSDIESVTETIKALKEELEVTKATARPVNGDDADPPRNGRPTNSQVPHLLSIKSPDDEPGMAFARYVKCHTLAKGDPIRANAIMKSLYPNEQRVNRIIAAEAKMGQIITAEMLTKGNVLAATTTDATWAGALVQYQDIASEFLEWLRPQTIVGKFGTNGIPDVTRVPFNARVRAQISGGAAYWVGEGKPKPLTKFDFTNITMAMTKVACIAVVTMETLKLASPSADNLIRNALRGAVIERMDRDFIDPDFAGSAAVSPASITYGAPSAAASGVLNSHFIADTGTAVDTLLQYFPEATLSGLVWLMAGRTGYRLGQGMNSLGQKQFPGLGLNGGDAGGIPVITSEYLAFSGGLSPGTGSIMVLVHAPSIFLADEGEVTLNASSEASIQMLDNPTNDVTTPTATSMVSMFQTNSVAILAERAVNWKRARDGAVYVVTGAAYTGAAA